MFDRSAKDIILDIFCCFTQVFLVNPEILSDIDMSVFPPTFWFISDTHIENGQHYYIKGRALKRVFIDFALKHPERVYKGTKEEVK